MMKQIVGTVAGVVSGYLVMAIVIIATFAIAFPLLGINRLFAEGTFEASMGWIALSVILGFGAALAGGWVAALVGGKTRAVPVLAGFVFVFGLMSAVSAMQETEARGGPRGPDATMTDAMAHARQPTWITFVNPLLGAVGVLIGGRRRMNF
jgi:hypothetical protein